MLVRLSIYFYHLLCFSFIVTLSSLITLSTTFGSQKMATFILTKLTIFQNVLQNAIDIEKNFKEKIRKVLNDISKEYEENEKMLEEIKKLLNFLENFARKVLLIYGKNKDLQTMRSLLDVLRSIKS